MANTWIATPVNSDERVAQFRSTDFDPCALYERHGEVAVFDLTDEMKLIGFVSDEDGITLFTRA